MISSFEKDTSLKPEAVRTWEWKSQVWNVVDQRTVWDILELNAHCKKRGEDKGNLKV